MASGLGDAIRQIVHERGISEDLVEKTVEELLIAAYKRKFGSSENAVIRFSDDLDEVFIFARKRIVDDVMDPVEEIELVEALEYNEDCEIGDELLIEVNPRDFERVAVQSAKQKAKQTLREIQKDTLYSEYADKVGEMIIGYYQRERNGNIYVDLGKTEGVLPKRYQSPREIYRPNDRIKAMIYEVNKTPTGLQIVLTRTHTDFVKRIFELEVPEIYDKTVEIFKLVREPGYRIKIAVYSNRDDVDPVGACVGMKGVRIQSVVRELEGEKIDILKYEPDPRDFIRNALSPAEVNSVVLFDEAKRQALAVVEEGQLSLAIGKQGLNVRLANRLVDWNIDVKTPEQFAEMDIGAESKKAVFALFGDIVEEEEITSIGELPDLTAEIVAKLKNNGVELIENLIGMTEEELIKLEGLTEAEVAVIQKIISENIEVIDEEDIEQSDAVEPEESAEIADTGEELTDELADDKAEEEVYECPECGNDIAIDMTACPNCGVGLSFEFEEGDDAADDGGDAAQNEQDSAVEGEDASEDKVEE
ncbi:MAG: transcription termination/antitermination protein NusA [Spirochaetales bacterium]|jgi:transcription termination/antitermination protein NusA|nr:transcription termination/antitermination protein NusA [Spirochaetales bacterium]